MIEKRINVLIAIQNKMPRKYVEKKFNDYKEEYNQLGIRTIFDKIDNIELLYEYNKYMKVK